MRIIPLILIAGITTGCTPSTPAARISPMIECRTTVTNDSVTIYRLSSFPAAESIRIPLRSMEDSMKTERWVVPCPR